jgi:hypothetical protein
MNSEVHPVVARLVLITTVMAIALWAWASGVAAGFGGPAAMNTGRDGHHFIEIQSYLVEHDEDDAYLGTHDLDEIGVELVLGGYAVFSNGDILVRRGGDPRSFLDNLRAYKREKNLNSIVPDEPGSGLYRCNLGTFDCTRFGVFIDWQADEVYVSDTTRHLVRKYSSDGREQAPPVGGPPIRHRQSSLARFTQIGDKRPRSTNRHYSRILIRGKGKLWVPSRFRM